MQQDMHYYGVGFLAMVAGLKKEDAETVAYASQYVDDSVESMPLNCGTFEFNPVRTAHNGLGAVKWTVQRKIHIPFHFLPKGPLTSQPDAYVTVPDSELANGVIDRALTETDRNSKLIAFGIAMHSYADTWAHSGFLGKSDDRNDVAAIKYKSDGKWIDPIAENIALDALPKIGHAQASHYPDFPWLEWQYEQDSIGKTNKRKNLNLFLDAAKNIHSRVSQLREASEKQYTWDDIKEDVQSVLSFEDTRIEIRIREWKKIYHKYFGTLQRFTYNPMTWRNAAFEQEFKGASEWDRMTHEDVMATKFVPVAKFFETKWVKFHYMARNQRSYVLKTLFGNDF